MLIRILGSAALTNGSRRPKNIRIRIRKTASFFKNKSHKKVTYKTVEIKVFLTIFARWWKDPEPEPYPETVPYLWLTDPDADPGGPTTYKSYGSGSPTLEECIQYVKMFTWICVESRHLLYISYYSTVVFGGANTEMGFKLQMSKSLTCNTGPGGLALFDHVLRHGEAARVLRIIFPEVRSSFSTELFSSVRED